MKAKNMVFCAGLAVCATSALAAKPPLQSVGGAQFVAPISATPIALVDGKVVRLGETHYFGEGNSTRLFGSSYAGAWFDSFEARRGYDYLDAFSVGVFPAPSQVYADCTGSLPCTSRWYFGPSYANPFSANDMTGSFNYAGGESSEGVQFSWFCSGSTSGTVDLSVAVFSAETFDTTCAGPAFGGVYPGIQYGFGPIPFPSGYYYTAIDLQGSGLAHTMPSDASGGYLLIGNAGTTTSGAILLTTAFQPMLWGTHGLNATFQGPVQWDDDNPLDGTHTSTECYSYAFGVCPDPLGSSVAFYVTGCTEDWNRDGVVDSFDYDDAIDAFFRSVAGTALCDVMDYNNDGYFDSFDYDDFVSDLADGCP